jgi:NADH-quinone oxidoreductase subunit J
METWLFYIFGGIALVAALGVVLLRRVFYSALALIICLSFLAGIYLLLESPFIAAVQIIVYAGAIMVLFLFVIMLLDPFSGAAHVDKRKHLRYFAWILGASTLLLLVPLLSSYDPARAPQNVLAQPGGPGSVAHFAETLFRDYLLPFEVTSVLIVVAIIGVVVLARRRI